MKHQFKPFDKVLVRDHDHDTWTANLYSHYFHNDEIHQCVSCSWKQCIPYNEETANLLGTNKPYEQPKPKTYQVEWLSNSEIHRVMYTDEEFENFIKTAVIHNKDVQNFSVIRINN